MAGFCASTVTSSAVSYTVLLPTLSFAAMKMYCFPSALPVKSAFPDQLSLPVSARDVQFASVESVNEGSAGFVSCAFAAGVTI